MQWIRQPGEIAAILTLGREDCLEVDAGCTAYVVDANGGIGNSIPGPNNIHNAEEVFLHFNELSLPLRECYVSSDAKERDLLVWCDIRLKVGDAQALFNTCRNAGNRKILTYKELEERIQDILGDTYTHYGIGNLQAPGLAQVKYAIGNVVGQICPGLCVDNIAFYRICTPAQHAKTIQRWMAYTDKLSKLYRDWQLSQGNAQTQLQNEMDGVHKKMKDNGLLNPKTGTTMQGIESLVGTSSWLSGTEQNTPPPPSCDRCGLPLSAQDPPEICSRCGERLHREHFHGNSTICSLCHAERRKWRFRFAGTMITAAIVALAALICGKSIPPKLPLKNNAYYIFDNGFANGWVPQYYMVDPETGKIWTPDDYKKAIHFQYADSHESAGKGVCLRIDFRPKMAKQGWVGLAWTLRSPKEMERGVVVAVNLSDADAVEFDARTDRQLNVEFKAMVLGTATKFDGDSTKIPVGRDYTLNEQWQHFRIPLGRSDVTRVVTPFYVSVATGQQNEDIGDEPVSVYVRNVCWTFPKGQWSRRIRIKVFWGAIGLVGVALLLSAMCFFKSVHTKRRKETY